MVQRAQLGDHRCRGPSRIMVRGPAVGVEVLEVVEVAVAGHDDAEPGTLRPTGGLGGTDPEVDFGNCARRGVDEMSPALLQLALAKRVASRLAEDRLRKAPIIETPQGRRTHFIKLASRARASVRITFMRLGGTGRMRCERSVLRS